VSLWSEPASPQLLEKWELGRLPVTSQRLWGAGWWSLMLLSSEPALQQ
jgi:hypothetical protein